MSERGAPRFGEADLTNCDREPIHVPGSIQPHGALLAMREPELTIVQVSENVGALLDRGPEELLFHTFDDLLGRERAAAFREKYLGRDSFVDVNPVAIEVPVDGGGARTFDGVFHRSGGLLVLELEPAPPRASDYIETFVQRVRSSLRELERAGSVAELLQVAALRTRSITGFDRVMVYRFGRDWHGEVIAEARRDDLEPFLGLHYPASDIPRQARELYARSWLRLIPDVAYAPARLVPVENPVTGATLDLGFSVLRSVSPIHVEYLRNMGVAASMSISLLKDGALWGLIACHHTTPHRLPYEVRAVCEFLGQVLSWQLSTKTEATETRRRLETRQIQAALIEAMSVHTSLVEGLLASEEAFLGLAGATGGAVYYDGALRTVGSVPTEPEILGLVEWLSTSGTGDVFASDFLPGLYRPAEAFKDEASGLLSIALSRQHRDHVLWFRPEILRTVTWGGDPSKPVEVEGSELRLTPRKSFAAWKEIVRLHSTVWEDAEIDAARDLRSAVLAVIVRRAVELKRLNAELKEAVRARDDFLSIASHELKTPLSTLQLQFHMLLGGGLDVATLPPDRLRAKLELSERQVKRLTELVDALLDVTRIRSGKLDLRLEDAVDLGTVVRQVLERMRPEQGRTGARIESRIAEGVIGRWDAQRLDQVATNLVSNAFKYGAGKPITVLVTSDAVWARLVVRDEGIGLTPADQARIFHRFERAVAERDYAGLGLGLWITRQIVTRLGGEIVVDSTLNQGTAFTVLLPLKGPTP